MVRLEVQKSLVEKALRENQGPFVHEDGQFLWNGQTRVRSKQTGRRYEVNVDIAIQSNRRVDEQIAACLIKPEVRFEDLVIVSMLDSRLAGRIRLSGLPGQDIEHEFGKFLKNVGENKLSNAP